MKTTNSLLFFLLSATSASAQSANDTLVLDDQQTAALMKQIGFDSTRLLKTFAEEACGCINSVRQLKKPPAEERQGFSQCIDDRVTAYQLALKLFAGADGMKSIRIEVSTDAGSPEYKRHYYQLERRLRDSCAGLNSGINTYDEKSDKSLSKNADAMAAYNEGTKLMAKENHADAIPWFEKAVRMDPEFVLPAECTDFPIYKTARYGSKLEHYIRLADKEDLDGDVLRFLRQSYETPSAQRP